MCNINKCCILYAFCSPDKFHTPFSTMVLLRCHFYSEMIKPKKTETFVFYTRGSSFVKEVTGYFLKLLIWMSHFFFCIVQLDHWIYFYVLFLQDDGSASWRKHKKHFFILSNAGKPIYSRYVDPIMFNYVANLLKIFRKEVYNMAHVITQIWG